MNNYTRSIATNILGGVKTCSSTFGCSSRYGGGHNPSSFNSLLGNSIVNNNGWLGLLTQQRGKAKKVSGSKVSTGGSKGRRLGVKRTDGERVNAGTAIFEQRGTKIRAGENVKVGRDHTLTAMIDGTVKFTKIVMMKFKKEKIRTLAHVIPYKRVVTLTNAQSYE